VGFIRLLTVVLLFASLGGQAFAVTLNRGNGAEPDTLDPHKYNLSVELNILNDLFEGLVTANAAGEPVPGMAESWEVSADGTVYLFRLRPGLKWSDGAPVTTGDIVAGFQRGVNPATGAQLVDLTYAIRNARAIASGGMPVDQLGVRAPDDRTIEITLEAPDLTFIRLSAALALFYPVPQHIYRTAGEGWVKPGVMVSNGPFALVEWTPQSRVRLVKNPHFHAADTVKIDEVIYYPAADENAALKQFRTGELDLHNGFPVSQYQQLKASMPEELHLDTASVTTFLTVNQTKEQFKDVRVRRALSLAIDRETLTDRVLNVGQVPAYSVIPAVVKGFTPAPENNFSARPLRERQAEARRLLEEAGFGPSNPLSFRLDYRSGDANKKAVVAIASMLAAVGVKAKLQANEVKVHYAKIRQGDFEVADAGWQGTPDPAFFSLLLATGSESNYGKWSNPEFDRLTQEAARMTDPATRMAKFAEADRIAMADVAMIPLFHTAHRNLVKSYVKGWVGNATNIHLSRYLSIER
jgi:oligopeptide transport system substrate-binding protein